jgi:hypothetical protein
MGEKRVEWGWEHVERFRYGCEGLRVRVEVRKHVQEVENG